MVACVPKLVSSTWNQYAHRYGSSEARRRSHNRAQRPAGAMGRSRLVRSLNSLISQSRRYPFSKSSQPCKTLLGFRPICTIATADTATSTPVPWKNPFVEVEEKRRQEKHSILLEKLRTREARDAEPTKRKPEHSTERQSEDDSRKLKKSSASFEELGLSGEVMEAVRKFNISVPTEIQRIAIPAVLEQQNLVLGSHTGSGKTLAYMLPLVQLLRQDEALRGRLMKPRNPRAIVLCPTRELSEQVCRVAKSICHHARFRCLMVGGGSRIRFQKDALNEPIDMVVGTPGRVLEHIEGRTLSYSGLKYLVLDEADTMFDRGFGPDIQRFIHPLKCRASQSEDKGYQAVLVAATITKPVQKLIDKEFQGITHLRTSTMHKTVASARHAFIKLSGSQDKLEVLLQVLEPILSKKQQVMVFCNTLDSSRAVDHFLVENNIYSANYHGAVPAKQRVENLNKFKDETVECHTLVCSDLAARGLDLHVDHVIMFDFPLNSIDYLHRTGRTARMGAKGKVTSLVTKRDLRLANKIEEAITKNTSLESISVDEMQQEYLRSQITQETKRDAKLVRSETEKKLKADEDQPRAKPQPEKPHRAKILPWLSAKSTPRSSHQRVAAPDGAQRRISARRPSAQETRARLGIAGLRKLSSLSSHCE